MRRNGKNQSSSSEREPGSYETGSISIRNFPIPTIMKRPNSLVKRGSRKSDCQHGLRMPADGKSRKFSRPISHLPPMPGPAHLSLPAR